VAIGYSKIFKDSKHSFFKKLRFFGIKLLGRCKVDRDYAIFLNSHPGVQRPYTFFIRGLHLNIVVAT